MKNALHDLATKEYQLHDVEEEMLTEYEAELVAGRRAEFKVELYEKAKEMAEKMK